MKRFSIILLLITSILTSCINSGEKASVTDLQLMSGISDQKLMLDGTKGSTKTFSFRAKHDWQIIDYSGFECNPSSGAKCAENEIVYVTATTLQANNSADTILLSDLNFKLLSTRFVGISAYQLPQVCIKGGNTALIEAIEGSSTTARIVSKAEEIELITTGDIAASLGTKNNRDEYVITITATSSNTTTNDRVLGTIGFAVNGVEQEGKIEVIQIPAIVFDRSVVMLPGEANRSNRFEVKSGFEIGFTSESSNFAVTNIGNNCFEVTSATRNSNDTTVNLGKVEVYLTESPECRATIEVCQRKALAPQTIIVQFIGTALREPYFSSNISKMIEALSKDIQGDAQVVILTTDSTTKGSLYELRYDAHLGTAVKERITEFTMPTPYNKALLESNLRRALEFAPAEKYALIIGSHGLGWVPKDSTHEQALRMRRLGIDPERLWERDANAEMTRHLGDRGSDVRYNVTEVAEAILANNIKLDYLLFDACFMGNIESVYELRNATNYIVGSPCEVMGYGFPYNHIMQYMLMNRGTSYDLDKLCSTYVDYYRTNASTPSACVALTNTSELEALAAATKRVNEAAVKSDFSLSNVQYYEGQSVHSFYDLGDMVEQSCADSEAVAAFQAQLDKTVTSRYHTDRFYSAYGGGGKYYHDINYYSGITTSANVAHYADSWQQTAWYKATH